MYPTLFRTPGVKAFAEAVDTERAAQLAKWGDQRHPDIDHRDIPAVTHRFYEHKAYVWQTHNEERANPSRSHGRCTNASPEPHTHTAWDGILLEEVYEALAEADPAKLRTELIQVAAVCAAWVHDLDRR